MIGHVEGVFVGQTFADRRALHDANVHRGLQQGISVGGESIILSGGYIDDEDSGDTIIYTGQGGRDLNTGRQIEDQTLTRGNLALAQHYVEGNPVRVIRGSALDSPYAPTSGYRYDGLYRIESYWKEKGKDGFDVIRFKMSRLDGQIPLGDILEQRSEGAATVVPETQRVDIVTSRIIRNTQIGNEVKKMYDYACQVCGIRLETPAGPYAECCHIKPLGRPHNGPDVIQNVLCLCPNHHIMFDAHAMHISDDYRVIETGENIELKPKHDVSLEYLAYHRNAFKG